jgi:hypothetical protein
MPITLGKVKGIRIFCAESMGSARQAMCVSGKRSEGADVQFLTQAGTVFHRKWAGKHRQRFRFREAFFGSFFGIKERTEKKRKANREELNTERKSEYHAFPNTLLPRAHRLKDEKRRK